MAYTTKSGCAPAMKVSIVTLSFNQAAFLERAIRSVLDQDWPDIEFIVVDPGSTDGSRDIIARYADRIAHTILEPDRGPADGLNKGFAAATGEMLGYLNADDTLLPGALRAAAEELMRHPEVDVVVGHGYIVDAAGRTLRRFRSAPFALWRFAFGASVVMQQSTFFRRRAFVAAGGFNTANRTSWDAELMLRMGLAGCRFRLVDGWWSTFTIHDDSISGSGRLNELYVHDLARYARLALRREPRRLDRAWYHLAWAIRWLRDPVGAWQRLSDRLFGPPRLPGRP